MGPDGQSEGHGSSGSGGEVPTGEKEDAPPPRRFKREGNKEVPHFQQLGEDGDPLLGTISQETSQTRGPQPHVPVSPAERWRLRQSTGGWPLERPSNRGQSGPALGGSAGAARARSLRGTRGDAHREPGVQRPCSQASLTSSWSRTWPCRRVLRRHSVLGDHFRIQQSPGSDADPAPSARKRRPRGRGRRCNPSAAAGSGRDSGLRHSRVGVGAPDSTRGRGVRVPGRVFCLQH